MVEQVLTRAERGSAGNSFSEQEPISLAEAVGRVVSLSTVRQGGDGPRQEARPTPPTKRAGGGIDGHGGLRKRRRPRQEARPTPPTKRAGGGIDGHGGLRKRRRPRQEARPTPPTKRAGGGIDGHGGLRKRRRRTGKPRRGGWRATSFISHEQYREARRQAGLLAIEGYRFTVLATARPPLGMTDAKAKRHICRSFARLGQALERAGHAHIGMTTYENPVGGRLHGHLLLHVLPEGLPVVKRWAQRWDNLPSNDRRTKPSEPEESVDLHARPAVWSDLQYALKEHQWAGPDFEPARRWHEKANPIVGPRVSFTKTARAIIRNAERRAEPPRATPVLRVVVSNPLVPEPVQLTLFSDRPVARLGHYGGGIMPPAVAQEVEARRHWRDLTQERLAELVGISRPTLTNALQGRFGLSEWAAARLREALLPIARAA